MHQELGMAIAEDLISIPAINIIDHTKQRSRGQKTTNPSRGPQMQSDLPCQS